MLNLSFKPIDKNNESEIEAVVLLEQTAFPPKEVREEKYMRVQIEKTPELFLIVYCDNKLVAYLNGISTNEEKFRDNFYTDMNLCEKDGKNIMLLGLAVNNDYQKKGIGRALMNEYINYSKKLGHKKLFLTCLPRLVGMYEKFGFSDCGISDSTFAGEKWHDMLIKI